MTEIESEPNVFDQLRRIWDFEDVIASRLTAIGDELERVEGTPQDPERLARAKDAVADIREALQNVSSHSRGKILSGRTLEGAIDARLSRLDPGGPAASVTVVGEPVPLDRMTVHDILMVFHEAIENVLRHANAGAIRVGLVYAGPLVMLLVEDDGVGYAPETLIVERGLRRMKERTIEHAGSFEISSVSGWGTTLGATFSAERLRRGTGERTSVIVVDPRAVVVVGLAALAARADPRIAVVGEFTSAADAARAAALARPRLALVGLGFGHETPSVVEALQDTVPGIQIVVVSDAATTTDMFGDARGSGIAAFVDARATVDEVLDTIVAAARGDAARRAWQSSRPDLQQPAEALTDREREVRGMLLDGASNHVIASSLGLSVRTVEKHVSAVLRKVGARNRIELLAASRSPAARTE